MTEERRVVAFTCAIRKQIHHDYLDMQWPVYQDEVDSGIEVVADKVAFALDVAGLAFEKVKSEALLEQDKKRQEAKNEPERLKAK